MKIEANIASHEYEVFVLAQDLPGCCTLQNLHKYQPALAMSPQHFSSATTHMLHSLAPQGASTAILHQCINNPKQPLLRFSIIAGQWNSHNKQTNATIKQTTRLKLPEYMTMYMGRKALCKCIHCRLLCTKLTVRAEQEQSKNLSWRAYFCLQGGN